MAKRKSAIVVPSKLKAKLLVEVPGYPSGTELILNDSNLDNVIYTDSTGTVWFEKKYVESNSDKFELIVEG